MSVDCFVIGICGGSGSGKTTFAKLLERQLEDVGFISQDNYYHDQSALNDEEVKNFNFDHPDSIDLDALCENLTRYKKGSDINIPKYCFETHARLNEKQHIAFCSVVIVEGIHIYNTQKLREVFDLKVFLDLDSDMRFIRRLKRDVIERGRVVESVVSQYEGTTRPMYKEYVDSKKQYCDLIFNTESEKDYDEYVKTVITKTLKNNNV